MSVLLLIVGLILFIGLVVIHEFGHFIAARRGGVDVEEFGIFFPPRLYKRRMKGGWDFTINLLPLGGFVKLKGEHDTDTEPHSFGAASLKTKTKVMAAGVFMNLLTALVLLTFLALVGMPKLIEHQFTVKSDTKISRQEVFLSYIEPGSPAAKAGLQSQDKLLSIDGRTIASPKQLHDFTTTHPEKNVTVKYSRGGDVKVVTARLLSKAAVDASQKTDNPKGYLGVSPTAFTLQRSTWSAPVVAVGFSAQITKLTLQGLGHAVGGLGSLIAGTATGNTKARQHGQTSASSQVSGPVGIFFVLKTGSALGVQFMLLIIAIISLTLAIMNILPIPALDGGRLWLTLISRGIFKKPLSAHREEVINASGFAVLLALIAVITFVDVKRFF
ncbi:MAG: M50 family metallopeptidase [Patescibacteria group bacterium]|nr:M50 family metallopeptidase [Patescibacteria group bacterium]